MYLFICAYSCSVDFLPAVSLLELFDSRSPDFALLPTAAFVFNFLRSLFAAMLVF